MSTTSIDGPSSTPVSLEVTISCPSYSSTTSSPFGSPIATTESAMQPLVDRIAAMERAMGSSPLQPSSRPPPLPSSSLSIPSSSKYNRPFPHKENTGCHKVISHQCRRLSSPIYNKHDSDAVLRPEILLEKPNTCNTGLQTITGCPKNLGLLISPHARRRHQMLRGHLMLMRYCWKS